MSEYKLVSLGRVVENPPFGSEYILVDLTEILYDKQSGLVKEQKREERGVLPSANGNSFQSSHEAVNHVRAKWRPVGSSNRVTPPNVRMNEEVNVYTYGDNTEEYYWSEVGRAPGLRDTEHVIYSYSSKDQGGVEEKANKANSVTIEIDTNNGFVEIHTPNNRGEPTGFDFKIDYKNGIVSITDTNEQSIVFNSPEGSVSITTNESFNVNTKEINLVCETYNLDGNTATNSLNDGISNITPLVENSEDTLTGGDETIKGNTTTEGVTVTSGIGMGGEATPGKASLQGDLDVKGNADVSGKTTTGDLDTTGTATGSYPGPKV